MKTTHFVIIIIFVIAVYGTSMAHGELVPKTLAKLYQEYQGKLIVRGQVMSVSENTAKNLTSYDIKILDYITRPQQASVITAVSQTENQTIPVFQVGDNVQLYLDRGFTGYEISPYSFKMDKKCTTWFGPSHLSFELPLHGGPASDTRFLDSNGNVINPSLNHEFVLATDGVYTPLDSLGFEVHVSLNDNPNPIFHNTKQFNVQPCTYASPTWRFTPTEYGNYTIFYKVIGGIYQDKIILDNATITTGFTIENSSVNKITLPKKPSNFIGNDLIRPSFASPLKQFRSGISAQDVTCKESYVLTIKSEDGSPACVRPLTVKVLTEGGWSKFESAQSNHSTNAKTNPFGIVGLMYYYGGGSCGIRACPLNTFNLKMNSNYTTYLLGYNICNDNSCIARNNLSILLPLNVIGMPDYKFIALPENHQWKYTDMFHIQVEVSHIPDNKTAVWTDLGNSTIIH